MSGELLLKNLRSFWLQLLAIGCVDWSFHWKLSEIGWFCWKVNCEIALEFFGWHFEGFCSVFTRNSIKPHNSLKTLLNLINHLKTHLISIQKIHFLNKNQKLHAFVKQNSQIIYPNISYFSVCLWEFNERFLHDFRFKKSTIWITITYNFWVARASN